MVKMKVINLMGRECGVHPVEWVSSFFLCHEWAFPLPCPRGSGKAS